jgi:hypothetical protein
LTVRLAAAGGVLSACVAAWAAGGDWTGRVGAHLALWALAFAAYLVALHDAPALGRLGLRLALGLALAWRAVLCLAPPLLSDDVYRSVWEGRIQLLGGNPYAWDDRPAAERWSESRDEVWALMNHREYTAIYPPLWQLAAAGVAALGGSVTALKAFLVLCELLTLAVLWALLRRRGLPDGRLLTLAWSPLALVEIAGSGHSEPLGMLLLAGALLALELGRPTSSALLCALGFQAKLLPGLVALAWARRFRTRAAPCAVLAAVLLLLPYLGAGRGLLRSLAGYASQWRFNQTLHAPLAALLGRRGALAAAALALILVALALAWRRVEPARAGLVVVGSALLLAPCVLPWYALWLLPFLTLCEAPAALLFTGTVGLAYLVYPEWRSGGAWQVGWDVRALEYLPCLGVALVGLARRVSPGARVQSWPETASSSS